MVIETFKPSKTDEVYKRFKKMGRLLPSGLKYIDSWLSVDRTKCFQLMETENLNFLLSGFQTGMT
jgi:hypothetical protein